MNLFQDNCVVSRTSAQAFCVHQDNSEFHRTPFQEFCNTVHNQSLSQTVIQDTVSSLVTSRTLSLDTSAYSYHEEFSVHMVALHRRVFASGVPNYRGLRIPVLSKLIVPRWRSYLSAYYNNIILIISSLAGQLAMITNNSVSQSVNYAITLAPPTFPLI